MEFLRFGSSIPGGYWGCCAVCIIQNFKYDPAEKASIQIVSGDGGNPMMKDGGVAYAGPTYEDIFNTRLRIGTFSDTDMPNHVFLAVLTESQINGGIGKKWLEILKKNGFEFIRTTDNSVYTGPAIIKEPGKGTCSPHKNYIFGLFRNIGRGAVDDPFTPPKAWTDLADPYGGDMTVENVQKVQLGHWDTLGAPKLFTEAEIRAAGAPVTLAGRRMPGAAPEKKEIRDQRETKTEAASKKADPFALKTPVCATAAPF